MIIYIHGFGGSGNLENYDDAISTYKQMQIDHPDQRENLSKKMDELKKKVRK